MSIPTMTTPRFHTRAELLELWRKSLVVDGHTDPRESALHELSQYFHISVDEARRQCLNWVDESIAEWGAQPRDTPEALLDFYRTQRSWIFDTTWYQAQQYFEEVPAESVMIADRLRAVQPGHHLDFGAGPGGTSLFFHQLGWDVSLADISTTMQAFARWRMDRRGISATYYDTSAVSLPANTFDVITACDVMVHVPNPREVFVMLHRALKVGGYLFFNIDARAKPTRDAQGHLYAYAYPVLRPVRSVGFAREPKLEFFHVFRKLAGNPPWRAFAVTAYDTCRYNLLVSRAGQVVRDVRARRHER